MELSRDFFPYRLKQPLLWADNHEHKYQEGKILEREEKERQVPARRSRRVRIFEVCVETAEHQGKFDIGKDLHDIEEYRPYRCYPQRGDKGTE